MANNQKKQQILITGCQRSGTTLLSLILDSHNAIKSIDEADFDIKKLQEYLCDPNSPSNLCLKLPEESANLNFIKNILEKPKVIWIIRDPRDVVVSMINLHIKLNKFISVSWALNYAEIEIAKSLKLQSEKYLTKYEEEIKRYIADKHIPSLLRTNEQIIFTAALCWKLKQLSLDMFIDNKVDFYLIKYEDLVKNPREEIKSVLEYLNLGWDDNVLQHHLFHAGYSIGDTKNDRPIDKNNIGKWRKALEEKECKIIEEVCSEVASKFGYNIEQQYEKTNIISEGNSVDLAEELIQIEEYSKAEELLYSVIKNDTNNIDALNNLGVISVLRDNFDEAKNYIEKVLSFDPTNEIALGNYEYLQQLLKNEGKFYENMDNLQENAQTLVKNIEVKTNSSIIENKTTEYDYQKLIDEEIEEYNNIRVTKDLREGGIHDFNIWNYWSVFLAENVWKTHFSNEISNFANTLKYAEILSLGCGYGGHDIAIAKRIKTNYRIIALDINPNLFTEARERVKREKLNVVFQQADLNFIELEENSFDIIYAHASLHHIINLENLFYQLHKGLKKEGRLVILDIIMYGGDGLELLQEIKKMDSNIISVVLTGYGLESVVNDAKEMGADYVILKPCEGYELRRVVKKLLNKKNNTD